MTEHGLILVTGVGGGIGGVGGKALLRQRGFAVRAMAHHNDNRADACARSAPMSSSVTSPGQQTSRQPSTRSSGCSSP